MQNLKPIAVVHGIFVYSTMMIFEYSSQKYLNIRIRSTFVLRIYSYSYSVQNMILNIFVFVFVLKRTFRIYSYSYSGPKKIFATLCTEWGTRGCAALTLKLVKIVQKSVWKTHIKNNHAEYWNFTNTKEWLKLVKSPWRGKKLSSSFCILFR